MNDTQDGVSGDQHPTSLDTTRCYLIRYDITSDQRRERLANELQTDGDRIQYNAFLVDATLHRSYYERRCSTSSILPRTLCLIRFLGPLAGGGTPRLSSSAVNGHSRVGTPSSSSEPSNRPRFTLHEPSRGKAAARSTPTGPGSQIEAPSRTRSHEGSQVLPFSAGRMR
jgi:hypothetical protein